MINSEHDTAYEAMRMTEHHRYQVQGFLYGFSHVIRDLTLAPDEQEVFRITQANASREEYERCHLLADEYAKRYRFQIGFNAALSALSPSQCGGGG